MSLSIGQTASATSTTSSPSTAPAAATSAGALNEADFMQLLVAQLKNQDPTAPVQGTEFVTQLAQFSLVQQSTSQTQMLGNLSTQLTGLSNNQSADLVGKTVTVSGNSVTFNGTSATPSSVTLSSAAASVTGTITDSSGNVVQTLNLGPHAAGAMAVQWDGHDSSGGIVPVGNYSVSVSAANAAGQAVNVSQSTTGVVQSISYAQGYPELTLVSGAQAPISQLVSVGSSAGTSAGTP
jgi:flagellar basal-body rod modification protein FlgD